MQNIITLKCPKCNNNHKFYKYGKDTHGNQKYQCRMCNHQFAPDSSCHKPRKNYPPCPICGKGSFLHHDYNSYSNYRCNDKKCNHSFFVPKNSVTLPTSVSKLFGKSDLKRMRFPLHIIISVLYQFFIGKSSTRNISILLEHLYNIKISHVTIAAWCKKFAPIFDTISKSLITTMDFNSDEWHADETVIKINGQKHYIWFIIDAETRFILGFHVTPSRSAEQARSLFHEASKLGTPSSIVTDRLPSYNVPAKLLFPDAEHIKVRSFADDITNNIIESFNNRFKAWYKTKRGFRDFDSANAMIAVFVFFFNFIRPHQGLNGLTPAQVAGATYDPKTKNIFAIAQI